MWAGGFAQAGKGESDAAVPKRFHIGFRTSVVFEGEVLRPHIYTPTDIPRLRGPSQLTLGIHLAVCPTHSELPPQLWARHTDEAGGGAPRPTHSCSLPAPLTLAGTFCTFLLHLFQSQSFSSSESMPIVRLTLKIGLYCLLLRQQLGKLSCIMRTCQKETTLHKGMM